MVWFPVPQGSPRGPRHNSLTLTKSCCNHLLADNADLGWVGWDARTASTACVLWQYRLGMCLLCYGCCAAPLPRDSLSCSIKKHLRQPMRWGSCAGMSSFALLLTKLPFCKHSDGCATTFLQGQGHHDPVQTNATASGPTIGNQRLCIFAHFAQLLHVRSAQSPSAHTNTNQGEPTSRQRSAIPCSCNSCMQTSKSTHPSPPSHAPYSDRGGKVPRRIVTRDAG